MKVSSAFYNDCNHLVLTSETDVEKKLLSIILIGGESISNRITSGFENQTIQPTKMYTTHCSVSCLDNVSDSDLDDRIVILTPVESVGQ